MLIIYRVLTNYANELNLDWHQMARSSNLIRRGAVYYALIHVPSDLQHSMGGKKQIWRSLATKDYQEAKRRKVAVLDAWLATFDNIRRRRELSETDMKAAVWEHYTKKLEEADFERANRPSLDEIETATNKASIDALKSGAADAGPIAMINAMSDVESLVGKPTWDARLRAARLKRLRLDLAIGDTRLIEADADRFLAKHKFIIERGGVQYRELCFKLMRADIEQLKRYMEREKGDYTGEPRDPIVVEPSSLEKKIGMVGEGIMELFSKYEAENPNNIRPETLHQARRDVQHFADFVGFRVLACNINRRHVRNWKEILAEWPVKASETAAFAGLGIRETVLKNKNSKQPKPTITRNTMRRYMASLSGFCRWLVRHDYLQANPVADMLPKKNGPTNKRTSFSDEVLFQLFSSPLFSGCKSEIWRDADEPGEVVVRDHRYWIPYIMLYSGARPAEIAQLHVGDVRELHGIWVMHITEEGEGAKRTKTSSSMRVVPIHQQLIHRGFLSHFRARVAAEDKQIFPEVTIPQTGQIAAQFSREFNRYLVRIGIKTGKDIVTYGLRHTFVDRARLAGFSDEEIGTVVGHDKPTMTGRYGNEQEGTLKRRAEIVDAVRYPTVDSKY